MTDQECDQLDRLMAKVMGWKEGLGPNGYQWWWDDEGVVYKVMDWQPSRLIQQALMVLEKMREQKFSVRYAFQDAIANQAYVWVSYSLSSSLKKELRERADLLWWWLFIADWPEVICLAVKAAWEKGSDADVYSNHNG